MQVGYPATLMRGGTSRGLYFLRDDLPGSVERRDRVLLAAMGSPDPRQIDGAGGGHPLTSKIAVVARSQSCDTDVDYLFLQVHVDEARVSDAQNCGNILAGVAPFAIEQGLVESREGETDVRIRMLNTGGLVVARVQTPGGLVTYEGEASIDGVPGTAAPVMLDFADVAGSSCGALLPTGQPVDVVDELEITCVDNGMPVVLMRAADLGLRGDEKPADLEQNQVLRARVEAVRLHAGRMMNLGEVADKTVPKMSLVSPPREGGAIATRTFIPHRVHEAIGVLGAASVAAACVVPGTVADGLATRRAGAGPVVIEHPSGSFAVEIDAEDGPGGIRIRRSALLRTARKIMQGTVFVPEFEKESS